MSLTLNPGYALYAAARIRWHRRGPRHRRRV